MSLVVQFVGADRVLQAFENRGANAWGLFSGKQLIQACSESDNAKALEQLSAFLEMIDNEHAIGTYTLAIYDDLKNGEKIKNTTPQSGAYNFKLQDREVSTSRGGQVGVINTSMLQVYRELDKTKSENERLKDTLADAIEQIKNPEQSGMIGQIKEIFELPVVKEVVMGIVGKLFGGGAMAVGQISTIPAPEPVSVGAMGAGAPVDDQAKFERILYNVTEIEAAGFHNIAEVLDKLSHIAKTDATKLAGIQQSIKLFL